MLLMHANDREDIDEDTAYAGDIVAIAGPERTSPPAMTLCANPMRRSSSSGWSSPIRLSKSPVEPKTKADQEKMGIALKRLAAKEDPSFRVTSDEESGQTIIKGMGELHLEILVDRMKREFKVDANVGAPQVAYREKFETRRRKLLLYAQKAVRRFGPVRRSEAERRAGRARFGHHL